MVWTYCGDYSAIYTNSEALLYICTPKTNISILKKNFIKFKSQKKNAKICCLLCTRLFFFFTLEISTITNISKLKFSM